MQNPGYPVQFSVDYPDRQLNRLTTFFRAFTVFPIMIVLTSVAVYRYETNTATNISTSFAVAGTGGLLFLGPLLMILFRQKYPRWWFDWNRELLRFFNRVAVYLLLMDDRYPSTDEEQSVHLEFPYPNVPIELNRWLPLVKWFLVIPHYVVLSFLGLAACIAIIIAWFAILFTGSYPHGLFTFVEGVLRWHNRVAGYALLLVTDSYPPFRLSA